MKIAPTALAAPVSGRMVGVLCILLLAGCAAIQPSPQPVAPAAPPAGAGVAIEAQREPAAPIAQALPSTTAQPEPVAPVSGVAPPARPPVPPPVATAEPPAARTAPSPAGRDVAQAAAVPPKLPPKPPAKAAPAPTPAAPASKTQASAAPVSKALAPAPPAVAQPVAAPALDLKSLETRLKETKAIGVFTKLTLKNQIDDLLDRFRAYYQGRLKTSLDELRRSFNMLVLKVVTLLQDADPPLAGAIVSSRESLWEVLSNPAKFGKL